MTKQTMNSFYLFVYIIVCIFTLGAVWFLKNMIQHAILDASQKEK